MEVALRLAMCEYYLANSAYLMYIYGYPLRWPFFVCAGGG